MAREQLKMMPENVLIHIGKCGGTSLRLALREGNIGLYEEVHIKQPIIDESHKYFIVTRSPIARSLSAFNWRFHLVVTTDQQPDRFAGEKQILLKYKTMNSLAEALYFSNGTANALAQGNFRSIHHLGENISFYLSELLNKLGAKQIGGVFSQESLADDAQRILGISVAAQTHRHKSQTLPEMLFLSALARRNLTRFLRDDFRCMDILDDWGKLSPIGSAALAQEKAWAVYDDESDH